MLLIPQDAQDVPAEQGGGFYNGNAGKVVAARYGESQGKGIGQIVVETQNRPAGEIIAGIHVPFRAQPHGGCVRVLRKGVLIKCQYKNSGE
jgi:hypothetical protein